MTLGELIMQLRGMPQDSVLRPGFRAPHSYRGYYHDLAFAPCQEVTVGEALYVARSCVGGEFDGWKGGKFTMNTHTDVWLANFGDVGEQLTHLAFKYMVLNGKGGAS